MQAKSSDSTNLDLLRAVAVLCVYANHLWDTWVGKTGRAGSDITWHIGQLGVAIFFVHTALVLMWSAERQKKKGFSMLQEFYTRRLFRIYPLSVFCVLFVFFLLPQHWSVSTLLANISLTQNLFYRPDMIYVLWSLPLEVQMYIVLPFLYWFCRKRSPIWVFVIWMVSVPIALVQHAMSPRLDVFSYAPNFLGGIIAWRIMKVGDTRQLPSWLWLLAIPIVSTIWMISDRQHNMWFRWLFGLALGLAIPLFADITWKWLTQASQAIAKYSYGIYLTHTTILWFVFTYLLNFNAVIRWSALILLSATVPIVLYHLIEAPMIKLSKRCVSNRASASGLQETPMIIVSEPVLP